MTCLKYAFPELICS